MVAISINPTESFHFTVGAKEEKRWTEPIVKWPITLLFPLCQPEGSKEKRNGTYRPPCWSRAQGCSRFPWFIDSQPTPSFALLSLSYHSRPYATLSLFRPLYPYLLPPAPSFSPSFYLSLPPSLLHFSPSLYFSLSLFLPLFLSLSLTLFLALCLFLFLCFLFLCNMYFKRFFIIFIISFFFTIPISRLVKSCCFFPKFY